MADYYSSNNAYTRSNANNTNNTNSNNNGNGYYSNSNNGSNNSNDMYSNPYGGQPQQTQSQQQPIFSNFANNTNGSTNSNTNGNADTTAAPTQSQAASPSLWNPVMATKLASTVLTGGANGGNNNEAMYQMGLQMGSTFLDQGTARLIPGLETFMKTLRVYFAVDNGYVKRKMMRVLFSFFHKNWGRLPNNTSATTTPASPSFTTTPYALPINDDNAPDLYIPFMSLITYVLLCALCYGTAGQFDPEIIMNVTTKCIFTQLIEVCLFKCGVYMMNGSTNNGVSGGGGGGGNSSSSNIVSFFDLFAFTGYKYLALTCNMIVGLAVTMIGSGNGGVSDSGSVETGSTIGGDDVSAGGDISGSATANISSGGGYGHMGYYIMFLWTASSVCYFMLKTMGNNIPYEAKQFSQQNSTGPERKFVILAFALSQIATMWFLGLTKFLK